jgi:uncharacterized protein YjiS (DUF1127 family)
LPHWPTAHAVGNPLGREEEKPGKPFELPPIEGDFEMTMLNTVRPNATPAPAIRRTASYLLELIGGLLDRWISAVIEQRARQADIAVLRRLSDRELKDIGLTRGDLSEGLAEAARRRTEVQRSRRS